MNRSEMINMIDLLQNLNPVLQALVAASFTWGVTSFGAAVVFLVGDVRKSVLHCLLGFAGGVMLAASFWSLLEPSIEMSRGGLFPAWVPATLGFLIGGFFMWSIDKILPHLHSGFFIEEAEGIKTNLKSSTLIFFAMTLHNIPEGLAIGVAFGGVSAGIPSATLAGAVGLAIGIAIQDFLEGVAVSVPLRCEGASRSKSFWYGLLSGSVEPVGAVIGAWAVIVFRPILPYALAFAAGAMIYVVIEEVIPESQRSGDTDLSTLGAMTGFAAMMILEVMFG